MESIIKKHDKIVLMFSGGRDSLACLFLMKKWLNKILVLWVNAGDEFPENESIIREHTKDLPNFCEVKSDVKSFIHQHGFPSDVVPINYSEYGQQFSGKKDFLVTSQYHCCATNKWQPAYQKIIEHGATLVIRGDRADEKLHATLKSGAIDNGIEFLFPIENWTREDVDSYLKEQGFVAPEHFAFEESSLDCMCCTGFRNQHADRLEYMKKKYSERLLENKQAEMLIDGAILREMGAL